MGVKQHRGKWQVDLRSAYVGVFDSEATARMVFAAGQHQLALGKPLPKVIEELRGRVRSVPTLDAFAEEWFGSLTLDPATVKRYRTNYARLSALGKMSLSAITSTDVRRVVAAASKRYAPKSVSVSVTVLRSILADAVDAGLIDRSPAMRISNLPTVVRQRDPIVLTRAQYRECVEAAPERDRRMVEFMPLTGLRIGELIALRFEDVSDGKLDVRRQYTAGRLKPYAKGHNRRVVDLSPRALEIVEEQRGLAHPKRGLVFPAVEGGYYRYDLVTGLFAAIRESTGIPLRPHDMRHTFGSWLIRAGYDVAYVAARIGHRSASFTLRVYTQEVRERHEQGMSILDRWLDGDDTGTASEPIPEIPPLTSTDPQE